jgi:hypothetical protein
MNAGPSDFMDLFAANAPWQTAAAKIHVFKVSAQLMGRGSDTDLAHVFEALKARHIALAVEIGLLSGDGTCGRGMEGYSAPRSGEVLAAKVRRLAGNLEYIALDEPLWFGRYGGHERACHSSISDIAREVAANVAAMRRVFPTLKVGDIEPIGVPPAVPWTADLSAWLTAYRAVAGANFDFLQADMQWGGDWQAQGKVAASLAGSAHIPFGVIINSGHVDQTDRDWTAHAEERLAEVRSVLGRLPDQVIFQSWTVHPTRYLPDSDPATLTGLVAHFRG